MNILNKNYKNIFVTSDTHFSHANIIKYCNRPYKDYTEMNEKLIFNWNNVVSNDDLVFHLGDFQMLDDYNILYDKLSRLNGDKILILGNHDYMSHSDYINAGFKDVIQRWEGVLFNTKIVMCHYQMTAWNWSHKGSIHLYGHEHAKNPLKLNHELYCKLGMSEKKYNVCVDANNYTPVNIKTIINLLKDKPTNNIF
jgi:calcineurin-like phosphoesterase family protein